MIVGRIDGTKYVVFFYGCDDKGANCNNIQFLASWGGYKVSTDVINKWNSSKRFGTAYLDKDGDPALSMSVNLSFGVNKKNFEDTFEWWVTALKGYKETVLKADAEKSP